MAKRYYVRAEWDSEAGVFVSKTNIPGLNVEAATLPEFVEIAADLAPQMLEANGAREPGAQGPGALKGLELAFT